MGKFNSRQQKLKPSILSDSIFSSDQLDAIHRQKVSSIIFDYDDIENGIDVDYYPLEETLHVDGSISEIAVPQSYVQQIFDQEDQLDNAKHKLTVLQKFPLTKILADDQLLLNCFDGENLDCLWLYLTNYHWIHSNFPHDEIANCTGTILTNDSFKGLQHTFVRHWDQWMEHIPDLENYLFKLTKIKNFLENVKNATNRKTSKETIIQLEEALKSLSDKDFCEAKCILLEAQIEIFHFLKLNLTSKAFRKNDTINGRLYFDVQDLVGNKRVMVVCLSRELFPVVEEFSDQRQVRLIITIYFLTEQEFSEL